MGYAEGKATNQEVRGEGSVETFRIKDTHIFLKTADIANSFALYLSRKSDIQIGHEYIL